MKNSNCYHTTKPEEGGRWMNNVEDCQNDNVFKHD